MYLRSRVQKIQDTSSCEPKLINTSWPKFVDDLVRISLGEGEERAEPLMEEVRMRRCDEIEAIEMKV